jgi:hypothetical protein
VAQLSSPPLLWRCGCCRGRMTGVMLGQSVVPVLLLTVHGHVHSIDGSECRSWGPPWLPVLLEGSTCPSGEAETRRGGQTPSACGFQPSAPHLGQTTCDIVITHVEMSGF